jgi:hypothetical protein
MSIRQNGYKKKLVEEFTLKKESGILLDLLQPSIDLWNKLEISDAEFALVYLLIYQHLRHGKLFLGNKRSSIVQLDTLPILHSKKIQLPKDLIFNHRLRDITNLWEIINNFGLMSIPYSSLRALMKWGQGEYHLKLFTNIPLPHDVLHLQRNKIRCVTVPLKKEMIENYILGDRDALSFFVHDLIHADHFFHENTLAQGQIGFYHLMHEFYELGYFKEFFKVKGFKDEFEYLISDMNAYCVHLMKGFKAIIKKYNQSEISTDDLIKKYFSNHTMIEQEMQKLNTPSFEDPRDTLRIEQFLVNYKSCF